MESSSRDSQNSSVSLSAIGHASTQPHELARAELGRLARSGPRPPSKGFRVEFVKEILVLIGEQSPIVNLLYTGPECRAALT